MRMVDADTDEIKGPNQEGEIQVKVSLNNLRNKIIKFIAKELVVLIYVLLYFCILINSK